MISLILAGEARVDLLRLDLPDTEIYLAGPNPCEPIPDEVLDTLHEDAERYEVVSALSPDFSPVNR
jgi:hypothetical protein